MASPLTLTEKEKVRNYLGYPSNFRYKNTRLEAVLEEDISDELAVMIREWLVKLDDIEEQISESAISTAGLKRVEDIEFYPQGGGTTGVQRTVLDWQRVYINKISIALGVPLYSDSTGKDGYLGDSYSGELGTSSKGRNIIPLG